MTFECNTKLQCSCYSFQIILSIYFSHALFFSSSVSASHLVPVTSAFLCIRTFAFFFSPLLGTIVDRTTFENLCTQSKQPPCCSIQWRHPGASKSQTSGCSVSTRDGCTLSPLPLQAPLTLAAAGRPLGRSPAGSPHVVAANRRKKQTVDESSP